MEEIMEMKLFCKLWSDKQMCSIMIIFNVTKSKKRIPDRLKKLTICLWFQMFQI